MGDVTRRDAVLAAVGLTAAAGHLQAAAPPPELAPPPRPAGDPELSAAFADPQAYFFTEQATFRSPVTGPGTFELVFTSGGGDVASIRPGTMRVFRAGPGELTWRCGGEQGAVRLLEPRPLVMAVRDADGTVRCYALALDVRC